MLQPTEQEMQALEQDLLKKDVRRFPWSALRVDTDPTMLPAKVAKVVSIML